MKTMKKTVSLLICAVMVATTVLGAGLATLLNAKAATITIGDITQQRVVDNYETTYAEYAAKYFLGTGTNGPTNMVIPGLSSTDSCVQQGMTYYAAKNWILISSEGTDKSVVFAVDVATGDYVAKFQFINSSGAYVTSHLGGIAASSNNLYFTDGTNDISYVPLSELDVAVGTAKDINVAGTVNLGGELGGAKTSYCSFSDGVLWTGNFYLANNASYGTAANTTYPSLILGYEISGADSAAEWNSFCALSGNPSYCVGTALNRIQCATVHDGKIYLSRSYSRTSSTNHIRELTMADIDLTAQGDTTLTVNGAQRQAYVLNDQTPNYLAFGGDQMVNMSEGICFIGDYLYILSETSAYKYNGGETTKSDEPIDVIWWIDPQAIYSENRIIADDQGMYTNAEAVLQADGTYTIKVDAFSTEDYQYQVVENRASDILYLVDASSSMNQTTASTNQTVNHLRRVGGTTFGINDLIRNENGTFTTGSTGSISATTDMAGTAEIYYNCGVDGKTYIYGTEPQVFYNDKYPYFIFDKSTGNFYPIKVLACCTRWYDGAIFKSKTYQPAYWVYYQDENGLCHLMYNQASQNDIGYGLQNHHDRMVSDGVTLTAADLNYTDHGDNNYCVDPLGISFEVLNWFVKSSPKEKDDSATYGTNYANDPNNMINTMNYNETSKSSNLNSKVILNASNLVSTNNYRYDLFCAERYGEDYSNKQNAMTLAYNYLESQICKLGSSDRVQIAYFGDGVTTSYSGSGFIDSATAIGYVKDDNCTNDVINYGYDSSSGGATYSAFSSSNALGLTGALNTIKSGIGDIDSSIYGLNGSRILNIVIVTDGNYDTPDEGNLLAVAEELKKDYGVKIYTQRLGHRGITESDSLLHSISSDNMSNSLQSASTNLNIHQTGNCYFTADNGYAPKNLVKFDINTASNSVLSAIRYGSTFRAIKLGSNATDKVTVNLDTSKFDFSNATAVTAEEATRKANVISANYVSIVEFNDPVACDASTASANLNDSKNQLEISGYNWSNHNKLTVEIRGVLPASGTSLTNPVDTVTGSKFIEGTTGTTIKEFNESTAPISIPEVTYVADFGVNMPLNNNGGTTYGVASAPKSFANGYDTSVEKASAEFTVDSGVANITLSSSADFSDASGYVFAQKGNGDYEWKKVTVVPASNVLYEESSLVLDGSGVSWETDGTASTAGQTVSTSNDVYGYDKNYNTTDIYSNGSALTASVNSENKKSDKATFTFTGTGFDLISACGPNTGIEVITVKQGSNIVKVFIIDTYYNDSTYGTLYQVPVVSFTGDYGTYTVETTAAYLSFAGALATATVETNAISGTELEATSAQPDAATASELLAQIGMEELADENVEVIWMDDNSVFNGGTGAQSGGITTQATGADGSLVSYIDGFRIYNPLTAEQAAEYYPASENGAEYYNVISSLESGSGNITGDSTDWVGYVEGGDGSFSFSDYKSNGPKNEVYLSPSTGITFSIRVNQANINSARAMLSCRAASGAPTAQILGQEVSLISATEMYIDISSFIGEKISDSTVVTTDGDDYVITVTVKNNGGGLLAVDNLKLVNCNTAGITTQAIENISALMSMAPSRDSLDGISGMGGRPQSPTVPNADPDLDPAGELDHEEPDNNGVLNRIISFLQRVFVFVKNVFVKFIGFFNLLKF